MNKNCYRIVFNKARGQLMAVAEIVVSRSKGVKNSRGGKAEAPTLGLKALSFWMWAALGLVSFSSGAQAQIIADRNAPKNQQATIMETPNGLPQVNIQTPSAAGVSRNTYSQFDVERKGAILNNSRTAVKTLTGGWVQANPWLATGSARVILNEVNSSNPSQLQGYIEVAGSKAQVVVANPSGITCDGCGFINSNRVTLTTGTANVNGGQLEGYRVENGEIYITGQGMDASRADYTDLIARSVKINAGIWANQLKVTAGTNEVDVNHIQTTPIEVSNAKPSYAIDVSQLGGMYAGKITLVGTEDGVGVRNIGNIAASAGDIVVTADGRIENAGYLSGNSSLEVTASSGIENSGTLGAQKDVDLVTPGDITNQGTIAVNEGAVVIDSGSQFDNSGDVSSPTNLTVTADSGFSNSGSLGVQNNIELTTQGDMTNQGSIGVNDGKVDLAAAGAMDNSGHVFSSSDLTVTTSSGIANSGVLGAQNNMDLTANGDVTNQGTIAVNEGAIAVESQGKIDNSGTVASATDFTVDVALSIVNSGSIGAQNNIDLNSGGKIDNQGFIGVNEGAVTLGADDKIDNSGQVSSHSKLTVTSAQSVENSGSFESQSGIDLTAKGDVFSQGFISANQGDVAVVSGGRVENSGDVSSNSAVMIAASGDFANSGFIGAQADIDLSAKGDITNQGDLEVNEGSIQISANHIDNAGNVSSGTDIVVESSSNIANSGNLSAQENINLTANSAISNQGSIGGNEGEIKIVTDGAIDNSGTVFGGTDVTVTSSLDGIDNSGSIGSQKNIDLAAGGTISNLGVIEAEEGMSISAKDDMANQGLIAANRDASISTEKNLDNTNGEILAVESLDILAPGTVTNKNGQLLSNQSLNIQTSSLMNDNGTIRSVQDEIEIQADGGPLKNELGKIEALKAIRVTAEGVNNAQGSIVASKLDINSGSQALDNHQGEIVSTGKDGAGTLNIQSGDFDNSSGILQALNALNVNSGTLDNDAGLIQSFSTLDINTNNHSLINTKSGDKAGIVGQSAVTLKSGNLDNQSGYIGSGDALNIQALNVNNSQQATIESSAELNIRGTQIDNSGSQIQSQGDVEILVNKQLDNVNGVIGSTQALSLSATQVNNSQGQLLSGEALSLNAINGVNNTQGEVIAENDLSVLSSGLIDNTEGLISSASSANLQDTRSANKTLKVVNTDGTVIANQKVNIDSKVLTGDGELLGQGDIIVKVIDDYLHTGLIETNGLISLETAGILTNQSNIQSVDEINLKAATIDNQVDGQVSANKVSLQATDSHTLINRGLINGQDTFIDTITLDNLGTGRIYGDHLAIKADAVNNLAEGEDAPVIAARERLDIGANDLTNSEHALIFSAGDLSIGGSLDENWNAIGQASVVNNNSATIEAIGDLSLSSTLINNTNEHLTTYEKEQPSETVVEYRGEGSDTRFLEGTPGVYTYKHESWRLITPERQEDYKIWYLYNYQRTVTETDILTTDSGKILSGGDILFAADNVINADSQIIAGGSLSGEIVSLDNKRSEGQRVTHEEGTVRKAWRKKRDGKDTTRYSTEAYVQADEVEVIELDTVVYEENTNPNGTGTQLNALVTGSQSQEATVTRIVSITLPDSDVTIRTLGENIQFPNNSLYQANPNPNADYFFETDPVFINGLSFNQTLISSDYLVAQLNFAPGITTKRLGDAYYEQMFLREQIQQLTGSRFLSGYQTDEEQYLALMNNAIEFANEFSVAPGVALTDDQMENLTTDIVWMVEKEITQSDGSVQKVLVPQLYVSSANVEVSGSGGLISASNIDLNLANDLNNSGTIQSGGQTKITANNLNNLNGRIQGRDVDLQARTDLNNLGGKITAENSLSASAGRDLNIASTTSTQTSSLGSRTNISSVAEVSVTGGNGDLNLSSGRDLNIKGAKVTSQSTGDTNITAGNNLNLETVTETVDQKVVWDKNNWIADSSKTETGSQIQTNGNLNLKAGQDLNARAAEVTSTQGDLSAKAGGTISLTAGENTTQSSGKSKHKNGGLLGGTEKSAYNNSSSTAQKTTFSGNNVSLESDKIELAGTDVNANESLNLTAKSIDVASVNETTSSQYSSSSSDMLNAKSEKNTDVVTTNVASNLNGKGVTLNATDGDITLTGSDIDASGTLKMDSTNDIKIQSGYEGSLHESEKKESSFLSGGNLFSQSEDLEGKLVKADVQSNIKAKDMEMNAGKQMTLDGVNLQAEDSLTATAESITITNAEREEKTYSKHSKVSVGLGDLAQSLLNPDELIETEDGKMSITLAKAEYESADHVRTETTAIASNLEANNISLTAKSDQNIDDKQGNISLTGTNLSAKENIDLNATNKVTVKEAKNTVVTEEKDTKGKAEMKAVVKNEYVLIKTAAEAVQKAQSQLEGAKSDYDKYQKELKNQKSQLTQLKQDLKNGKLGIEQVDIDEMEELISDLESDDGYYKANIALAATNLATKTTALAAQTAKAAASTGTYGFNAGLELDIDATENQLTDYEESSLASNLNASNITINSGDKTTLQGTNLNAKQDIQINSKELDVLASTDVQNSTNTTDHKNLTISYDFYGGPSASASADSSKATTSGVTNTNSTLSANNITINTAETTHIEGANINAQDQLNLSTQNLDVASVQDSQTSKFRSQGASAGVGSDGLNSVGYNSAKSDSKQKEAVLTTLTGNQVNINVDEHTSIQGATIAAVDENGNDNGQLTLTTQTLEASSLNNTLNSQSQSVGVNASLTNAQDKNAETNTNISSVGLDYSNDRTNSKTKTLATIGQGNIQVGDTENSDTKMLNRDIQDNEVDIYNVSSHKGLSGSLDTRLLTEDGRAEIQKDLNEFGQNLQKASQGLPEADNDNPVIAAIGKTLNTASELTGGVIPSNGTNGGLIGNLPIYFGDPDNQHRVIGDETSKKVYIPGILNDEESAMQGGKNIIGEDQSFQVWTNPSHGAISDVLEAAVDLLNPLGLQTGISKQVEQMQKENKDLEIYPHSQGNAIAAEGARNTQNGHTYFNYGAPMPEEGGNLLFKSLNETFKSDAGKPPTVQKNDGDYVANPLNVFNPETWSMPGHATENYGAAKLKKEQAAASQQEIMKPEENH